MSISRRTFIGAVAAACGVASLPAVAPPSWGAAQYNLTKDGMTTITYSGQTRNAADAMRAISEAPRPRGFLVGMVDVRASAVYNAAGECKLYDFYEWRLQLIEQPN